MKTFGGRRKRVYSRRRRQKQKKISIERVIRRRQRTRVPSRRRQTVVSAQNQSRRVERGSVHSRERMRWSAILVDLKLYNRIHVLSNFLFSTSICKFTSYSDVIFTRKLSKDLVFLFCKQKRILDLKYAMILRDCPIITDCDTATRCTRNSQCNL